MRCLVQLPLCSRHRKEGPTRVVQGQEDSNSKHPFTQKIDRSKMGSFYQKDLSEKLHFVSWAAREQFCEQVHLGSSLPRKHQNIQRGCRYSRYQNSHANQIFENFYWDEPAQVQEDDTVSGSWDNYASIILINNYLFYLKFSMRTNKNLSLNWMAHDFSLSLK